MDAMVQSFREMGQTKLMMLMGVAVVLLGSLIFMSTNLSSPMMAPLYSNLPMEDSAQIVSELEKKGVPFQIQAGGAQVMVPADQVLRLRMTMAQAGLPSGGSLVGYEIFDRSETLGTSNFVLNINMLRALEGELARTIGALSQIDSARVHLVMPKRELFTRDKQEPTASVVLKLKGSAELGKSEIASITHLVATAVPGLKASRVTIVDGQGKLLARGTGGEDQVGTFVSESDEYRVGYENRMEGTIERLIEQSVGFGKVKAEVHADMDFDRIVTNSETYDPEGQVVRSIQGTTEKEESTEANQGDNVSVANQLPDGSAAAQQNAGNSRITQRSDETTNYEISKTVENHIKESGTVKQLSVAVLVDGNYTTDAETGVKTYAPRSEQELAQLTTLVKSAIGYNEKRGDSVEVINMPFTANTQEGTSESTFAWLKDDLNSIIETLVFGGVALLAILLIVRPLVNRAIEVSLAAREEKESDQMALSGPSIAARLTDQSFMMEEESAEENMINIDKIQAKVKSGSYNRINDVIDKHPDEALNVIRQWILREA